MSDAQFTILIGVIGAGLSGIGAVIKWSVGRIVGSIDANSTAMIENTKSNAVLSTKIDGIAKFVQTREETPVRGVPVTATGYGPGRPPTHGNGR